MQLREIGLRFAKTATLRKRVVSGIQHECMNCWRPPAQGHHTICIRFPTVGSLGCILLFVVVIVFVRILVAFCILRVVLLGFVLFVADIAL